MSIIAGISVGLTLMGYEQTDIDAGFHMSRIIAPEEREKLKEDFAKRCLQLINDRELGVAIGAKGYLTVKKKFCIGIHSRFNPSNNI